MVAHQCELLNVFASTSSRKQLCTLKAAVGFLASVSSKICPQAIYLHTGDRHVFGSVLDPSGSVCIRIDLALLDPDSDPYWEWGSGSVLGMRIRIRIGNEDPDREPGARIWPKLANRPDFQHFKMVFVFVFVFWRQSLTRIWIWIRIGVAPWIWIRIEV
jgi:hypothetical protein